MSFLVLDVLILIFLLVLYGSIAKRYLQTRHAFALFILGSGVIVLACQCLIVFGLGVELIDPDFVVRVLLFSYASATPIYCVVMAQKCLAFKDVLPVLKRYDVTTTKISSVCALLNALLCWPIYLHVFDIREQNNWINVYHFVGWGLWNTFLLATDLVLCAIALKEVIKIKRSLNTGVVFSKVLREEQSFRYLLCLSLLAGVFLSDAWNLTYTFVLVFKFKHPDKLDMNYLGCSFILHLAFAFTFLIALGSLMSGRAGTRKSTIAGTSQPGTAKMIAEPIISTDGSIPTSLAPCVDNLEQQTTTAV
eukprot:TRINITY_DN40972_c0_g1_i1.p1 TRINITY_DN40972_c0_g1~~TRINITY_DN40972_c0_g1_i1.p1  ORF type:complete len:306 (-),score=42.20 TRINITY_DN40972_c0_g1_i1:59-976(-)